MNTYTYICSRCKRELPADSFYFNSRKQKHDSYCKCCRREISRLQRKEIPKLHSEAKEASYPVITAIPNRALRLSLILQAKEKVREHIIRKRIQLIEEEWKKEMV